MTLLALGVAITSGGAWIGEPDIVWVGLLLVLLPLAGMVVVLLLPPRLELLRRVDPAEVPLGGRPMMSLELANTRLASFSALTFRDKAPSEFEADAHFSLARGAGRWEQDVEYDLQSDQRGHFRLGPLHVRAHDPLGMAHRSWQVPGPDAMLRVTPRVWELASLSGIMGVGSSGEATPQRIGLAGQDDILLREHRHGDDLRRVHWRMSAKQGELMVRVEEHPWDPAVTLLIDTRAGAHVGTGPDSTLEWVISLGASVADQLLSARYRVTILSADAPVPIPGQADTESARRHMLHGLTDLDTSGHETLVPGLSDPEALGNSRSMIAALGFIGNNDAVALATVGSGMMRRGALVPDAAGFQLAPARARIHDEACRLLLSQGWAVQRYGPGDDVPTAWAALMNSGGSR